MSDELKTSAYDRLTPQRKLLVDAVLKNLEKGTGLWEQGWSGGSAPVSAITGKQYNGVNRIFLMLASMEKGYSDNRWLTYKHLKISLKKYAPERAISPLWVHISYCGGNECALV